MIKLVPEQFQREISNAIAQGDLKRFKGIIEQNKIDVDVFLNDNYFEPVLMAVLLSYGFPDEEERLKMLQYVLEKGANPNIKSKEGYNCLHLAAQRENLVHALDLFLDFHGDVNLADATGATVAYWAIQSFPLRKQGDERQLHLDVLEKILMLGADLDIKNKFGATPRKWLEIKSEDVRQLAQKCEQLKPVHKPQEHAQPTFPTNLQYPDIAKKIWKELVPPRGQSETAQGELLRAIEKLRDEAQRNGNINYNDSHLRLAKFVADTLANSKLFDGKEIERIKSESAKLMHASSPYLADDAYDYLTDQICIFFLKNNELIKHEQNPQIHC